jgi:hypothetical protein
LGLKIPARKFGGLLKNHTRAVASPFTVRALAFAFLGYISCSLLAGEADRSAQKLSRDFEMGLAYWPPKIEKDTDLIVKKGVAIMLENSEHLLLQIPWSPLMGSAHQNAIWIGGLAARHHRPLTIAIDWMDIDRHRLLGSDANNWSFQEKWVETRFLSDVGILAKKYQPNFLVLGVEVDFMALKKPEIFRGFVATYAKAYRIAKLNSPDTKVSVSFQFEQIINENGSSESIVESPIVRAFGPLLDVLGLSVYPCQYYSHPNILPDDYLSSVIPPNIEVAIFETGWPSRPGDENLQKEYVEWILQATTNVSASLLVWISTTDIHVSKETGRDKAAPPCKAAVEAWYHRLGLWEASGDPKEAVQPWVEWLSGVPLVSATPAKAITVPKPPDSKPRY